MIFKYTRLYSAVVFLLFSTMPLAAETIALSLREKLLLPEVLSETSGLACNEESVYTVNDSGNQPYLYAITRRAKIKHARKLEVVNIDWEAIDMDNHFIYVADTGNNHGNRRRVLIHKLPRMEGGTASVLSIRYNGNRFDRNIPYQHDFDVEALVLTKDKLLLFTKSWKSGVAHVYDINFEQEQQDVSPIAHIEKLPGVVTGAAWDNSNQQFILVGYSGNALWGYKPFLAVVDKYYKLRHTRQLAGMSQVEAVCVRPDGEIWLTQEASRGNKAMLIKLSRR